MIISKTPFRISLFGGSTDYKSYYTKHGGLLIGFTINKYCYITLRKTPSILPYRTKVSYSQQETVDLNLDIKHPGVRATLQYLGINEGLELNHMSDLPAQTGIGSSSSFIVGLLNCLSRMYNLRYTRRDLAEMAIIIERDYLREAGGVQDQIWAAYGGFNSIVLYEDGGWEVRPLPISEELKQSILDHSLLIYTGKTRKSYEIASSHDRAAADAYKHKIADIAQQAYNCFLHADIQCIGEMLDSSWQAKKKISDLVSTQEVDSLYSTLRDEYNMIGGKLLGTGGSGFIFAIFESPEAKNLAHQKFIQNVIDFGYDCEHGQNCGSRIIHG